MSRAAEIAALRALGFSLTQVAVLAGDPQGLEAALASHQATLEGRRTRHLGDTVETVRGLRDDLARGRAPTAVDLARLLAPAAELSVAFDIPWPWGGERFELRDIRSLNYIVGPLGSGKTRLAPDAWQKPYLTPPSLAWSGWRMAAQRLGHGWMRTRSSGRGSINRWLSTPE